MKWIPGRSPKVHPAEVTELATRIANLEGMIASGQPWQADCGTADTTSLLAVTHPDLLPAPVKGTAPFTAPLVYDHIPAEDALDDDLSDTDESSDPVVPDTVAALKTALTARGVVFPAKATKSDLVDLFVADPAED